MHIGKRRVEFRPVSESEAVQFCRLGLTPARIERTLAGAGLDFLAKKWAMTPARAAGLAVYYGILAESEANRRVLWLRGVER